MPAEGARPCPYARQQAREGWTEAARAFETFNIDLMYALPGQTLTGAWAPRSRRRWPSPAAPVGLYHLTIEPNTLFAKRPPRPCRCRSGQRHARPA